MTTKLDLDEAERLSREATPGSWTVIKRPLTPRLYSLNAGQFPICQIDWRDMSDEDPKAKADADFIAFARTFVPAAVERIRELEAVAFRLMNEAEADIHAHNPWRGENLKCST